MQLVDRFVDRATGYAWSELYSVWGSFLIGSAGWTEGEKIESTEALYRSVGAFLDAAAAPHCPSLTLTSPALQALRHDGARIHAYWSSQAACSEHKGTLLDFLNNPALPRIEVVHLVGSPFYQPEIESLTYTTGSAVCTAELMIA